MQNTVCLGNGNLPTYESKKQQAHEDIVLIEKKNLNPTLSCSKSPGNLPKQEKPPGKNCHKKCSTFGTNPRIRRISPIFFRMIKKGITSLYHIGSQIPNILFCGVPRTHKTTTAFSDKCIKTPSLLFTIFLHLF